MGGSPLRNDVWSGTINKTGPHQFRMTWHEVGNGTGSFDSDPSDWSAADAQRWSPRAGFALAVHFSYTTFRERERIFIAGGFASWPCYASMQCHPLHDHYRARNDVWVSMDGENWTMLVQTAPWGARAWHSLVAWSDLTNPSFDVATHGATETLPPRMWLAGGGYVGTTSKSVVRRIYAYYDLWWTRDGIVWTQVSRSSGSRDYLCSSIEAYEYAGNKYRGKYGHVLIPFWRIQESRRVCEKEQAATACFVTRVLTPALFFIAGDIGHVDEFEATPASDVFASRALILCDIDGYQCPSRQVILLNGGDLRAARRQVHHLMEPSQTQAGVCPDPLAICPDPLGACESAEQLTLHAVENASMVLDFAYEDKPTHTAMNVSKHPHHPMSLAGLHVNEQGKSLIRGFVARLQGCLCGYDVQDGVRVGQYFGEYCEEYKVLDGTTTIAPSSTLWSYLFIPLALLLRALWVDTAKPGSVLQKA